MLTCCLCNRPMSSASVFIGTMAVGPKCARRAGLVELARKRHGALRLAGPQQSKKQDGQTIDLFTGLIDAGDGNWLRG